MKIETLKDRIEKAETKISKKQATIEKKQKSIEKKKELLMKKFGWDADTLDKYDRELRFQYGKTEEGEWEIYWLMCDIDGYEEDIKRLHKEIPNIQNTVEKYKAQLAGEIERESMFIKEVPEAMKELEKELVEEWNRWDIERRNRLKERYDELGHREFRKFYTFADYNFMSVTEREIDESNRKFARQEVLDLYIRVNEVTGEVTDWSGIRCEQGNNLPVLTGVVIGKEGKASVETILAGGYNIQRLHIRTLVHRL